MLHKLKLMEKALMSKMMFGRSGMRIGKHQIMLQCQDNSQRIGVLRRVVRDLVYLVIPEALSPTPNMRDAVKTGSIPLPCDVFPHTITKKDDRKTFIDKRAENVFETMQHLKEPRSTQQLEGGETPIDEYQFYLKASGGKHKRRVYDIGSQASLFCLHYGISGSLFSASSTSSDAMEFIHSLNE
ncbi:hypothetical protein JCGZ_23629 [Jatropha curcas]|uniref:Uncharacterized protein n=1 Tax=Jatropha curcas TaxID=180498 RepID=A0A067LF29_JATCU|nr:hypothetical protein JCGZ_23629 [Jatropha curcas]